MYAVAIRAGAANLARVPCNGCALAVLNLSVGWLSAVARLVSLSSCDVTLIDATAAVLIEDQLVGIDDLGRGGLGRAVARELSLTVDDHVTTLAV